MSQPPEDPRPDTIATPEGDNEFLPDEPLAPLDVDIERPCGGEPHSSLPFRDALE
jgi:hypothetical protein